MLPVVLILSVRRLPGTTAQLNIGYALLALVGLLLCHASVNILNDYFDYKSGVDLKTLKTPFQRRQRHTSRQEAHPETGVMVRPDLPGSGGTHRHLLYRRPGMATFAAAYCGSSLHSLLYSRNTENSFSRNGLPGLGLGLLPVLGAYFVQTGHYTFLGLWQQPFRPVSWC